MIESSEWMEELMEGSGQSSRQGPILGVFVWGIRSMPKYRPTTDPGQALFVCRKSQWTLLHGGLEVGTIVYLAFGGSRLAGIQIVYSVSINFDCSVAGGPSGTDDHVRPRNA